MLLPCDACGRFVRAQEPACPFCRAARAPVSVAEPTPPRLSRAALAVASSLALGGCPTAVRYGGPPPNVQPMEAAPLPPPPSSPAPPTPGATPDAAPVRKP